MIVAAGGIGSRRKKRGAFTVVELLLAVAMIGMIAGLFVFNSSSLFSRAEEESPEETVWAAVQRARERALLGRQEVRLRYDRDTQELVMIDGQGVETRRAFDPEARLSSLQFLQSQRGGDTVLIGGQLVETREIPRVSFYPDGTCSAFRVQLQFSEGEPMVLAVDPWTCAPVLEKEKAR